MISNRPVVDEIALTFWPTVELMLACLVWAVPLGIALGTLAARRRGTLIDRAIMALSVMGVSVPVFWVGLLLIQYVGGAGLLPFQGRDGPIWTAAGFLSIILPAVTLGAVFVGPVARMTRTSLLETLGADYVRTARAKGASDWRVTIRHALRNAMIPVVTLVGLQIGFLLGGSIVTETMFAWPGVGRMAVGAITSSDFPLAQGAILMLAVGFMIDQPGRRRALRLSRSADRPTHEPDADPRPCRARPISAPSPRSGARTRSGGASCAIPPAAAAALFLFLVVLAAIFAPWIAPFDPYANNMRLRFCPPGASAARRFLLGADNQGRDMLSRILFGLRSTLGMGVIAVAVGGGLGALIGLMRRLLQAPRHAADAAGRRAALLPVDPVRPRHRRRARHRPVSLVIALSVAAVPSIARITRGAAQSSCSRNTWRPAAPSGLGDARPDLALPRAATAGRPS